MRLAEHPTRRLRQVLLSERFSRSALPERRARLLRPFDDVKAAR